MDGWMDRKVDGIAEYMVSKQQVIIAAAAAAVLF